MRKRIKATEMWFLRIMLRVPWKARMTNEGVLRRAGVQSNTMATLKETMEIPGTYNE